MPRQTKYTPECVDKICFVLSQTGSDKRAMEAGGITKETFYVWIKEKQEFSDRVSAARAEYRDICPEELVAAANKAFSDLVHGRMERVAITKKTIRSEKNGITEEETVQRIPVGVPRWTIERVLGVKVDELEAVRVLVRAGWLPESILEVSNGQYSELRSRLKNLFAGVLPATEQQRTAGITDTTADVIRREILGTEDSFALSAEMDSGQEPDQSLREIAADRD